MFHQYYSEIIGVASAAASLYAANSRTIIPLRFAAIIANVLAMTYSFLHGTYPTFLLNAVLLPLNAWRLLGMIRLVRDVKRAVQTGVNADWLLPISRAVTFKAGDIIMHRGEYSHGAFYITSGEIELVEVSKSLGAGTLIGEIGLFAPDGLRTATVRCKSDVLAARVDYDRFKELFFQNPEFGFQLVHLIVARLQKGSELPEFNRVEK